MPFPVVPDVEPEAFLAMLKYLYTFGFHVLYFPSSLHREPEAFLSLLKYLYCKETHLLLAFMYCLSLVPDVEPEAFLAMLKYL
jgi:hypothetical protein